jgi:hypothetical protein
MMLEEIEKQAIKEIEQERFRMAVEARKTKLLLKTPWWHKLMPFTISIKWRK